MIYISQIRINIDDKYDKAITKAISMLGIKQSSVTMSDISKVSIDARHGKVSLVCSVALSTDLDEDNLVKKINNPNIKAQLPSSLDIPQKDCKSQFRPVVVGFGPAGMFCSLVLARAGLRPIIIERGPDIDKRTKDVEEFWAKGTLNPSSNVQFGEGGAGTFSDGKLVTRINNPLCDFILKEFVNHGAPDDILYKAKPHVGTDLLTGIVKSIRQEILSLGGEIYFNTLAHKFNISSGKIKSVLTDTGLNIETDNVILAIGHSARDTFESIINDNIKVAPKPFSIGVRIEHLQDDINKGLYGQYAGHPALANGEYQLSHRQPDGRAVYTFCMCPGGFVVPSSSEQDSVVVNGMSLHARDSKNSNCGLVVSVSSEDYGKNILDGINFQRELEKAAFVIGGQNYKAPAQTVDNFLKETPGININKVTPSYSIGVEPADFNKILPKYITDSMKTGLQFFDKKLRGFSSPDSVLTGVETRTSSPIRILRNEDLCSENVEGLYPCGEGAGYAGGITSSAVDGVKVALKIIEKF